MYNISALISVVAIYKFDFVLDLFQNSRVVSLQYFVILRGIAAPFGRTWLQRYYAVNAASVLLKLRMERGGSLKLVVPPYKAGAWW